jgi:hypothetical protein
MFTMSNSFERQFDIHQQAEESKASLETRLIKEVLSFSSEV